MANSSSLPTPDETSGDLVPLPVAHRQALAAVTVIACVSVASSGAALLYLTIKLVRWHLRTWRQAQRASRETNPVDLSLGLADCHFGAEDAKPREPRSGKNTHPNQFLVLLFNLLLADLHQAAAFLLNAVWVGRNGILIHTPVCWAQGWLVSTGDLSSSLFITAIAVHTYSAVLHKYQPPRWVLYTAVVAAWAFDYFMATLGVLITGNGKDAGGFFVRAAAWCWVNIRYETHRLLLHYLWIFISLAITSILYTVITISLSKHPGDEEPSFPTTVSATHIGNPQHDGDGNDDDNNNDHQRLPPTTATTITSVAGPTTPTTPKPPTLTNHPAETRRGNDNGNGSNSRGSGSYPKVFLLYPVIYVVCTLPLAAGRIATMAGARVPIAYFCVAGALITSNGWLDVLLWGLTRRRLLFGADVDAPSAGLDTFTFMRTPPGRRYGTSGRGKRKGK